MDALAEYELLKGSIDELKVQLVSDRREKERLEAEFEELKARIKSEFGCELPDFEKTLSDLDSELEAKMSELKRCIEECREKMRG